MDPASTRWPFRSRWTPCGHHSSAPNLVEEQAMGKRAGVLLTKRVVDAATPGPARFDIWDASLAGFGLRVEKSGTKTFIVRYRADGGVEPLPGGSLQSVG